MTRMHPLCPRARGTTITVPFSICKRNEMSKHDQRKLILFSEVTSDGRRESYMYHHQFMTLTAIFMVAFSHLYYSIV